MKKRILCVILSLAAVFSLVGFHSTQAWFSSGKNKSQVLKSGGLDFEATGDLALADDEKDLILPGAELTLKEAISITNNSTIDSELRIRVECTYVDAETGETSQPFKWIEFVNAEESNWKVENGYIYYCPNGIESTDRRIPAPEIQEDGAAAVDFENPAENEIPFAGTIRISGDVPIDLQNKEMSITFVLEAKQADFVEWKYFNPVEDGQ